MWYTLDNAASVFPSITTVKNSSVFRIAAVLLEAVDKDRLQKAVDSIFDKFPMLFVKMRTGIFWNYFDSNGEKFLVKEEHSFPCDHINPFENNGYFLKILYYGKRISVEVFHSLTDGNGTIELLKSILFYYYACADAESEYKMPVNNTLSTVLSAGISEMGQDSFREYYTHEKSVTHLSKTKKSYRIKGSPFTCYGNNIITGLLSAKAVHTLSKAKNVTITAYLTALLIYSIYMVQQKYENDGKPIVVSIPVNLRKLFPSQTLKNFFAVVNIGVLVTKTTSIDEVIKDVSQQLAEKTSREHLQTLISGNVMLERSIFSKFVPLILKKKFIELGFNLFSESKKTITISNMGNIQMPSKIAQNVQHMEAVLYPTPKSPINCGIISMNDTLAVSFSRTIIHSDIIRFFFKYLSENGSVTVSVYSNDWGRDDE